MPASPASGARCASVMLRRASTACASGLCRRASPAQTNPILVLPAQSGQPRRPIRDACGIGGDIGHMRRDGFEFGAERERQAHQRAMPVEWRQRFAAANDHRCACHLRQQGFELRLDLQNDFGASLGEQRHVAHELQRVAKTLFGVKQQSLAGDVLFAEPKWCAESPPLRGKFRETPSAICRPQSRAENRRAPVRRAPVRSAPGA